MNRWRHRLAELQGNDPERPACSSASLHNVQTDQNVQNPLGTAAFEHFERIEQRTEGPRGHDGGETPFAPSPTGDICDEWRERVRRLLSRSCPDGVRVVLSELWHHRAKRGRRTVPPDPRRARHKPPPLRTPARRPTIVEQ
jgi:hypothetical protein